MREEGVLSKFVNCKSSNKIGKILANYNNGGYIFNKTKKFYRSINLISNSTSHPRLVLFLLTTFCSDVISFVMLSG